MSFGNPATHIALLAALAFLPGHAEQAAKGSRVPVPQCPYYLSLLERGWRAATGQSVYGGNSFNVRREAHEYVEQMGPELRKSLVGLGEDKVIVDFGDGRGMFGRQLAGGAKPPQIFPDFSRSSPNEEANIAQFKDTEALVVAIHEGRVAKNLTVVGVSFKPGEPAVETTENKRYRQVLGNFDTLPDKMLPKGTADLATDFFGVYSYSKNLSHSLRRMVGTLRKGAKLFIVASRPDLNRRVGTFVRKNGLLLTDVEWMQSSSTGLVIKQHDVEYHFSSHKQYVIEIQVTGDVTIPDVGGHPEYDNKTPPYRIFEELSP